jgi:CHAT domain-containing protein
LSLRERFPAADQLDGEAATKDALKAVLPGHDLLHLSTHGYADTDSPRRSGFFLAHGQLVTVADLRVWDTEALRLLVLSSCESALTGGVAPDEMITLPAAVFGSSGCQVIGTMWEAEQEPTALLFQAFYRHWNLSPSTPEVAAALQRALAEVRAGSDSAGYPLEHPVRWAPYILVG